VDENLYLHDAYVMMEEKRYRHLVVVNSEKCFVGVVSEGDFLRHIGFEQLGKFKIVAEAMSHSPLIVSKETLLCEVASAMHERKCDYAVILENAHPIGVVTERDIAHRYAQQGGAEDVAVEELIQLNVRLIHKDIALQEAATLMEEHGAHQLIVVDENENLVGLLSRHDVLHAVNGAYFEYLIRVIDQKNETISRIDQRKKELKSEKEISNQNALKLRKLFEALPDGLVLIDSMTMMAVEFNRTACEQLGYTPEEFAELSISDYDAIEFPHETRRRIDAIAKYGKDSFETVHKKKNGDTIDVSVNVVAIVFDEYSYMMTIYRDISEQKRRSEEIKQVEGLAHIGTWEWDIAHNEFSGSEQVYKIYGIQRGDTVSLENLISYIHPQDEELFRRYIFELISVGYLEMVYRLVNKEGEIKWVESSAKIFYDADNKPYKATGFTKDITERKKYEEQLETLANYDPLTGLANRGLLQAHLQNSIDKAKRDRTQIALLMFDLDRFKDINDSYGHSAGDELLQMVAERFSERLREGDLISRLGGDEFAVVLEDVVRPEDAGRLAEAMISALAKEYRLSSEAFIIIIPMN
jgi:diguanylate cyclase (GGDEF)-like protein/PAS domain S-box-containing protein